MDNTNGKTDPIAARLLLPLDAAEAPLDLVGGKGRSLAAMASAGMSIPDGFHLTTSACGYFNTTVIYVFLANVENYLPKLAESGIVADRSMSAMCEKERRDLSLNGSH